MRFMSIDLRTLCLQNREVHVFKRKGSWLSTNFFVVQRQIFFVSRLLNYVENHGGCRLAIIYATAVRSSWSVCISNRITRIP
jgi:hypothetical protein